MFAAHSPLTCPFHREKNLSWLDPPWLRPHSKKGTRQCLLHTHRWLAFGSSKVCKMGQNSFVMAPCHHLIFSYFFLFSPPGLSYFFLFFLFFSDFLLFFLIFSYFFSEFLSYFFLFFLFFLRISILFFLFFSNFLSYFSYFFLFFSNFLTKKKNKKK